MCFMLLASYIFIEEANLVLLHKYEGKIVVVNFMFEG